MQKSPELKRQVKLNQINYTLIALDLLAGVAKESNYIRHKDIVEVGNKIREMEASKFTRCDRDVLWGFTRFASIKKGIL